MTYRPETQEPQKVEHGRTGGGMVPGRLPHNDEKIMKDVALAMGPGPAARDSLQAFELQEGSTSGTQGKAVASPKELGSMWNAAKDKGDFSAVNAEMAKAVSAVYGKGGEEGIKAVKELRRQIHENIETKDAKPILVKTKEGIEIHNVQELPKADAETFEKMSQGARDTLGIMDVQGMGWVKRLGPIETVKIDGKPQAKPDGGIEHGEKTSAPTKEDKVPDVRQFTLPDGNSVSIHRFWGAPVSASDKNESGKQPTWDNYRIDQMYFGEPGKMKRLDIQQAERNMDGGTTISTSKGRLFIPGKNEGNELPTWTSKKENGEVQLPVTEQRPADSIDKQISTAAQNIANKLIDGKISEDELYAVESTIHQIFAKFGRAAVHEKLISQTKTQLEKMSSDNYGLRAGPSLLNADGLSLDVFNKQTGGTTDRLMYVMNNDPDYLRERREKGSDPNEQRLRELESDLKGYLKGLRIEP